MDFFLSSLTLGAFSHHFDIYQVVERRLGILEGDDRTVGKAKSAGNKKLLHLNFDLGSFRGNHNLFQIIILARCSHYLSLKVKRNLFKVMETENENGLQ